MYWILWQLEIFNVIVTFCELCLLSSHVIWGYKIDESQTVHLESLVFNLRTNLFKPKADRPNGMFYYGTNVIHVYSIMCLGDTCTLYSTLNSNYVMIRRYILKTMTWLIGHAWRRNSYHEVQCSFTEQFYLRKKNTFH